jgi:endo-1,4-beta-xylanase
VSHARRGPARRGVLAGLVAVGLTACGRSSRSQPAIADVGPLKSVAHFPAGCAVTTEHLADPDYVAVLTAQFSQLTPEWEMKMEYILSDDGALRFDAPDQIAAFARARGMSLFGHNLVWYSQSPAAFERLDGQGDAFARAYDDYITTVCGRFRGQAVGWDVVNEPVAEDGEGLRDSLWSRNLGVTDYMRRAFERAHAAAPEAVLFVNDYNLESLPKKRATYLNLVEGLLRAGAPLGGLGTQCHLAADLEPGALTTAITELAKPGLPIHVSELDISLNRARGMFASRAELIDRQSRLADEIGEAFARLPSAQRFSLTTWGLRDGDSWLRSRQENPSPPWDAPLFFDDDGRPKPLLASLEQGLSG